MGLNNLANLYTFEGRNRDAEPLYKLSLALREKILGPDHPDVAMSLGDIANVYNDEGRYAEAEPLDQRALAIYKKALGPDHREVGRTLNNLGFLYESAGRYADAEPIFKQALAIREKALGPDHPEVANTLNNWQVSTTASSATRTRSCSIDARSRSTKRRSSPSIPKSPIYRTISRKYIGKRSAFPTPSRCTNSRGTTGEDARARPPGTAELVNNLAWLYLDQERYADALPLIERLIANGRARAEVALPVLFGAEQRS